MVKEMWHIIFYAHVHACSDVVPAILTTSERHFSRFQNSGVFGLLITVMIVL